ncbi:MAG TPA: CHAT domain-containing tetratricopeptide repeat protein [Cyclobacteriaceae bacterium]|nr:CHAT domain-containing tetratricopeptide repeat protein [Cyclobacteriaceae bacterium]
MKLSFTCFLLFLVCGRGNSQSLEKKIDSLIARANYADAIKFINSSGQKSDLLQNKEAEALMGLGKIAEAEGTLAKINGSDAFTKAITQNNLGYLSMIKGRSDLAEDLLGQSRDGFKLLGKENTKESARCFSNLCFLYSSNKKLSQAEENGLQALQIRQSIFGGESEEVAASLNDLGLVYGQTDPEKGLSHYEQALAIYERLYDKDHPKIAVASTNIGLMYFELKLYGDAILNFETAQSIWKKTYPNGHPNEALALLNLGRTYTMMKNTKASLEYYDKALAIFKKYYGAKHPDIATVYNLTGSIKLDQNDYKGALADFQNAICANSPTFSDQNVLSNPSVKNFYNGKVLLYTLQLKAKGFESRHYGKTLKLQDLKLALMTLKSCDSLIDNIRHNSTNENDKIELGTLANEVYEDGVRIAYSISDLTPFSMTFQETAFYFAEKSKSAVLQESIADTQAKSFAGIPLDLIEQEKSQKSTIAFLAQKLSEKPSPDEEKYLRSALFNSNLEYQQFIKKLEADYPSYYNLKFSSTMPSVADLQRAIQPKQAVVSYFMAEKSKKLFQFVVTSKKFKIVSRSIPETFDRLTKGFVNSLLRSDFRTYKEAQEVAQIVKPQVPSSINSIIIIPSGRIGSLPLESMPYKKARGEGFKEVTFFVDRWAISYEFAAGLMLQKAKEKAEKKAPNLFLCAPIHFSEEQNLGDLPGTEREVDAIAKLFPNQSKVFTYDRASEAAMKSPGIQDYNYLHLATHGIVDAKDPAQSEIFLSSGDGEDGNLFCREIYNMGLRADLVVLSACETGLGKFSKGEGVIGLSRALTYAGAKNMIVSFWKVSDESTAELMISFYQQVIKNNYQNLSDALRKAKIDIIKSDRYSSPYYWAPFFLIGK